MEIDINSALQNVGVNKTGRKYPGREDRRCKDESLFPEFKPSFNMDAGSSVFTIGSCFARNIEEELKRLKFKLPTLAFSTPKSEWPARPNGLLNEYNPGTISQRLLFALEGKHTPEETVVASGSLYADLMLLGGADVTKERALERRGEIFDVYSNLKKSQFIIITLGLIEGWFDNETKLFINRMPPISFAKSNPKRFCLKVLDVFESYPLLKKSVGALCDNGIKVVLTVSPVPMQATFTSSDCIIANEFSKSVLRVCAERLCKDFRNVDYFPSYEIARSGGLVNYGSDNVHIKSEVVKMITNMMVLKYSNQR